MGGVLRRESQFLAGRPHGAQREWHADGTPSLLIEYAHGKLHGQSCQWSESTGTLWKTCSYDHGTKHGPEVWYTAAEAPFWTGRLEMGKFVAQRYAVCGQQPVAVRH